VGNWRKTDKWRPGRTGTASGGFAVEEAETGQLGFAKPNQVAQEKISSDLAREVGAPVPEVRLERPEGHAGLVAVSLSHGSVSDDITRLRERDPALYSSRSVQQAIGNASGLLPFHAWVKTPDLKDDHLVVSQDAPGGYAVAGIDFANSMTWGNPQEAVEAPSGPPALIGNVDRQAVSAVVEKIAACTDEVIERVVNQIPDELLAQSEKQRIIEGLKARRSGVRDAMRQRGWLP